MFSFENEPQKEQAPAWERLLRYFLILAITTVLFGSLYYGIQFLE